VRRKHFLQINNISKSGGFPRLNRDTVVEIKRRDGEHNIRLEDVLAKIKVGDELALVLIELNYYTGQVFDENDNCCRT
jgi:hypothetical protein